MSRSASRRAVVRFLQASTLPTETYMNTRPYWSIDLSTIARIDGTTYAMTLVNRIADETRRVYVNVWNASAVACLDEASLSAVEEWCRAAGDAFGDPRRRQEVAAACRGV